MSILPALCKENPPVTSGSPIKGPLMLKVYYFDRNYAESYSRGTRCFSDGLFYHYSDVIMSTVESPITSFTNVYSTVYSGKRWKRSKLRVTCLWEGNSLVTGEFPTQRASNAENVSIWWRHHVTHIKLENRYGFWSQTGCVTVPGREAAFLVARQRFPYRSRFNFSVTNMENMLPCNAICDIMHIDFSRKIYCGANDASIGF